MKLSGLLIHPDELDDEWIRIAKEKRLGVLSLHPRGGLRAAESMGALLNFVRTGEFLNLKSKLEDCGIAMEYEMHSARWLLPKELFTSHPEYFRMNEKGERTPDLNFCVSNTDALEIASQRMLFAAKTLCPSTHRYYFWMDDARNSKCHCPLCRDLSASDQQMIVLNYCISRLREYDERASLAYLAYFSTIDPPSVRPSDGIFLEYAPFDRDRYHTIFDPECEKNVRESSHIDSLLDFFGRKDSKVLEYWLDNSMYSGWQKPPKEFTLCESVMKEDVAFYCEKGFEFITSFACFLGKDYRDLYGAPYIGDVSGCMKNYL
ncbi:MAG: DUF4838 domain-containing protein [Clostridia bacterium]|nr:DUF4838 domain-containing protein [Clostridia bacterium]